MTASRPEFGRAPGKVILSGEHAAVYGVPALSMAVDKYTDVWFTPMHRAKGLRTAFENLSQGQLYPLDLLKSFKQTLDRRFEQFSRGELTVQKILQRPDDLAIYTLMLLMNYLPVPGVSQNRRLPVPGQLNSRSALPLGAGMGSSAAVIAATFVLYEHLFNHSQSQLERFERVRFCERLQHGKGSAVDAASVVYGGFNRVEGGYLTRLTLDDSHGLCQGAGWYWVLHGSPESSTGECVAAVRERFGDDQKLWQEFEACSNAMQQALEAGGDPIAVIRENHRLLVKIGVVPTPAQAFVAAVEKAGGAAKISGAGSVKGDNAGIVMVYLPDQDAVASVQAQFPERAWESLRVAPKGAHLRQDDAGQDQTDSPRAVPA